MTKRKTERRWREMGKRGATIIDKKTGERVPVRTQKQGETFFRDMAAYYPLGVLITNYNDFKWLEWLLEGHYNYRVLCPYGVTGFVVMTNNQIGHPGRARVFAVIAQGSDSKQPFSFEQALLGVPKTDTEKRRLAFRHAVDDQVWLCRQQYFRPREMFCPVTKQVLTETNVCMDHDPTFVSLVDAFCYEIGIKFENIEVVDELSVAGRTWMLIEDVRAAWYAFHARHARLHFVSIDGHRIRTNERFEDMTSGKQT